MLEMVDNVAVIDLGTNTFHIIIGNIDRDHSVKVIYRERQYVYLGKGGVSKISNESYQKGIETLLHFKSLIEKYKIKQYRVIGTAALRSASNGQQFVDQVLETTQMKIEVISGALEADYIFQGMLLSKKPDEHNHLIMDIGGGSVEFILFKAEEKFWSDSFNIGISVLHPVFQNNDPLQCEDLSLLEDYLNTELSSLLEFIKNYNIHSIIGASGTFEVLVALLNKSSEFLCNEISLEEFGVIYDQMMHATLEERLKIENLDPQRAVLIQIALFLVKFIVEKTDPQFIQVSPYALKEGVLASLAKAK